MGRAKWYAGLGVALLNDLNDIIGFGSAPIIGDVLDAATSAVLWPLLEKRTRLLSFIEFIPGGDYIPTYTILLLWSWRKEEGVETKEVIQKVKESGSMREVEVN